MLSDEDKFRYTRHLMLDEVGEAGQEKLMNASVCIIGAGGLGSPNALYLAAAGIGEICMVDFDKVDLSNLQRQILHNMGNLDNFKVDSARDKLLAINPKLKFHAVCEKITPKNITSIIAPYDFVIDATDNFTAKFLINDACILANKPLSHAGIYKFCGQTMTILPHKSACFACAFDKPPHKSMQGIFRAGLFGVVPGVLGTIQASEAIKYILGIGEMLTNALLTIDLKAMTFRKIDITHNPHCRVCGENGIRELCDYDG